MTERRSANRARMPIVASIVDEYRQQFPGLKVVYAQENGITVGTKPRDENVFDIPANYFPCKSFDPKGKK